MPKFNDLDLKNWKDIDLNMDSLWVIPERKKGGWVFDPFLGSATTAIECEELGRNIIGIDIQEQLVNRAKELITSDEIKKEFICGDSTKVKTKNIIDGYLKVNGQNGFDLAMLHPPYDNIIKFTSLKEDLSNCNTTKEFYKQFSTILENTYNLLKKGAYCVVVIGDKYQNSEWIPLGFGCMNEAQKVGFKLKSRGMSEGIIKLEK